MTLPKTPNTPTTPTTNTTMPKKTKRSKSGYSKKRKYYKKKRSYTKGYRRYGKLSVMKTGISPSLGRNQVRYYSYEYTTEVLLPVGLAPGTDTQTIQSLVWSTFTPNNYIADLRFLRHMQLSSHFRMLSWEVILLPTQTQVNLSSGYNATGKIILCPLHSQSDMVASGVAGITLSQTDIDRWAEMPHARPLKYVGGSIAPTKLTVVPSIFRYTYNDATFGSSGSVGTAQCEYTPGHWYETRDYDGTTFNFSRMLHYGSAVIFAGFDTPTTFQGFRVQYRFNFAFKGYDATADLHVAPISASAAAVEETKQPEVVEYYDLKSFHSAPPAQRKWCDLGRIDFDEKGNEVWRGPLVERNHQIRQNADENYVHEDHYEEVDSVSVASALSSMKRPAPVPQPTSSSSQPNHHQIKRAFTNMKL